MHSRKWIIAWEATEATEWRDVEKLFYRRKAAAVCNDTGCEYDVMTVMMMVMVMVMVLIMMMLMVMMMTITMMMMMNVVCSGVHVRSSAKLPFARNIICTFNSTAITVIITSLLH